MYQSNNSVVLKGKRPGPERNDMFWITVGFNQPLKSFYVDFGL